MFFRSNEGSEKLGVCATEQHILGRVCNPERLGRSRMLAPYQAFKTDETAWKVSFSVRASMNSMDITEDRVHVKTESPNRRILLSIYPRHF